MNIFKWFKWFTPKPKPKVGDFILTKEYEVKGKTKGGLVLRIEETLEDCYKCSKGSWSLKNGMIIWNPNGDINISYSNIERLLSIHESKSLLSKNIEKIK